MDLHQQFQLAQQKRENGQFDNAIADYQQIRLAAISGGDVQLAAECLHMIGVSYYQQNELTMAQDYCQQALEIFQRINDKDFSAITYRDLGLIYYKVQDFAQAKELLLKSVSGLKDSKLTSQYAMSQAKLGFVRAIQGEVKEGVILMQEAIVLLESTNDKFFLSIVFFDLARIYQSAEMIEDAKQGMERSLQILNSISSDGQYLQRRKELADLQMNLNGHY